MTKRPAAVAGIDGRVGLDEILAIGNAQAAALGADDARGHGAFQSEGLPEGQDPIADFHLAAASQPCRGERAAGVDADDGQVGLGIGLDLGGLEFPPVAQPDRDVAAAGDHVVVGKNDARRIDDHARAAAGNTVRDVRHAMKLMEELPHLRVFEHVAKRRTVETEGNLLHAVVAVLGGRLQASGRFHDGRLGRDRHHRRQYLLGRRVKGLGHRLGILPGVVDRRLIDCRALAGIAVRGRRVEYQADDDPGRSFFA